MRLLGFFLHGTFNNARAIFAATDSGVCLSSAMLAPSPLPLRWLSVAEAVASAASSALCNERAEHIGVLTVIMTEAELGQV